MRFFVINVSTIISITKATINLIWNSEFLTLKKSYILVSSKLEDPTLEDLEIYDTLFYQQQLYEKRLKFMKTCSSLTKKWNNL